jgi:hypothetical protein
MLCEEKHKYSRWQSMVIPRSVPNTELSGGVMEQATMTCYLFLLVTLLLLPLILASSFQLITLDNLLLVSN